MKKLTLAQAERLYNSGKIIYLKPSKLSPQVMEMSPWFHWHKVQKAETMEENEFRKIVNSYSYYNCNSEVGKRVNYYAYVN